MKKRLTALLLVVVIFLGFIVYANSLGGKFIWDDDILVKNNLYIRSWADTGKIFADDISAGGGGEKSFSYRPFQIFTYKIDYSFWKLNAAGYHFTNILLHILAALAVFWLVYIFSSDRILSFLTSLFFISHPLHSGAVAYISGRADSLAALFILIAMIFYIKNLRSERPGFYLLVLLSYILALLSREGSLILPVLFLCYHYVFKVRIKNVIFPIIIVITCFYVVFRAVFTEDIFAGIAEAGSLFQRLPGTFAAVAGYLRILLLPYGLHMEYGNKTFAFADYRVFIGVSIVIAALSAAFLRKDSNRLVAFFIFWFFIALLPVLNIYPINIYMAEHWLYLPSIGFFFLLANSLKTILRKTSVLKGSSSVLSAVRKPDMNGNFLRNLPKIFTVFFISGALFFYSYLSFKQNQYWHEPIDFYKRTLKYVPDGARLYFNLAGLYREKGEIKEAVANYEKALEFSRDKAVIYNAYNKLGDIYWNTKRTEESITAYRKAIEINPDGVFAYNNLGIIYALTGKDEKAVELFNKAIEKDNNSLESFTNLGNSYAAMGKFKQASSAYKKVLQLNPGYPFVIKGLVDLYLKNGRIEDLIADYKKDINDTPSNAGVYYILGNVYSFINKDEEAGAFYKKAIELKPGDSDMYNSIGLFYQKTGDFQQAIAVYEKAIKIFPSEAWLYYNLGRVYSDTAEYKQAVVMYRKFIDLAPDYAQGYNNLGVIYAYQGNSREAVSFFSKALKIAPDLAVTHSNLGDIYYNRKQYELAGIHYGKALALGYDISKQGKDLLKEHNEKGD